MNGRNQFDIDFESAYNGLKANTKDDMYQYWRPCYKINAEKIQAQDNLLGSSLEMFGQYD